MCEKTHPKSIAVIPVIAKPRVNMFLEPIDVICKWTILAWDLRKTEEKFYFDDEFIPYNIVESS